MQTYRRSFSFKNDGSEPWGGITCIYPIRGDVVTGWENIRVCFHGRQIGTGRVVDFGKCRLDFTPPVMAPGVALTFDVVYEKPVRRGCLHLIEGLHVAEPMRDCGLAYLGRAV